MTGTADLAALRAALGADSVHEHAPLRVDGVAISCSVSPADTEACAAALRALGERGLTALVRGAGTELALGNPPRRADVVLSTARLAGIEVDAEEGVACVAAGTPLRELRKAASEHGWEPPLDAPRDEATLGGILAAATLGPRCLGYRLPRDAVLGLEVVLGSGERTRCGGRVVKNVTGYDLAKLYTGSLGTLGVIRSAWLRLRPLPQATRVLVARIGAWPPAVVAGLAVARRPTARAAALRAAPRGTDVELVTELAGDAEAVESDAAWLARELGAQPPADDALAAVARQQVALRTGGLRFRVAALPSRLAAALEPLERAGAELLVYPGLALLYAGFELGDPPAAVALEAAFAAAQAASRAGAGSFILEAGPLEAKRGRDVFGEPGPSLRVQRALKQRFDPAGVLNAGRFVGGI